MAHKRQISSFSPVAVSAPSKIILHGEHAVVFGKTGLAGSLDLRTRIHLTSNTAADTVHVDFPDIGMSQSWAAEDVRAHVLAHKPPVFNAASASDIDPYFLSIIHDFLRVDEENLKMASLICFFYLYAVIMDDVVPMKIKVESEIPIGAGLGSSAALSVCLAAGLLSIKQEMASAQYCDPDRDDICRLALVSEKILHHTPSGIDNSVSTYGGVIKFVDGEVTVLKDVPRLRVLLVNTGVQRDTKSVVAKVRSQMQTMPRVVKSVLEAIDGVSCTCLAALEDMAVQGDDKDKYECLESLIDYNQKLLETLNVSHPALEDICKTAAEYGLHGKLTGAGGGGFAFILLPPTASVKSVQAAKDRMVEKGYKCWETDLGVGGVQVQRQNNRNS